MLALSILGCPAASSAPPRTAKVEQSIEDSGVPVKNDDQQDSGDINLGRITWTANGFLVGNLPAGLPRGIEILSQLVSIDDVPLKGLTLEGVLALLRGRSGAKAKIELLSAHGQMTTVLVERVKPQVAEGSTNSAFAEMKQIGGLLDGYDLDDMPGLPKLHRDLRWAWTGALCLGIDRCGSCTL